MITNTRVVYSFLNKLILNVSNSNKINRLYTTLSNCRQIIEDTSSLLTLATSDKTKDSDSSASSKIYSFTRRHEHTERDSYSHIQALDSIWSSSLDKRRCSCSTTTTTRERKLVIFNSNLEANRREIVSIRVNKPHIEIYKYKFH